MDAEELDAIRARWAVVSLGPWEAYSRSGLDDPDEEDCLGWDIDGLLQADLRGRFAHGRDAIAIAHAPTDIAALVAEVERLWKEREHQFQCGEIERLLQVRIEGPIPRGKPMPFDPFDDEEGH